MHGCIVNTKAVDDLAAQESQGISGVNINLFFFRNIPATEGLNWVGIQIVIILITFPLSDRRF